MVKKSLALSIFILTLALFALRLAGPAATQPAVKTLAALAFYACVALSLISKRLR